MRHPRGSRTQGPGYRPDKGPYAPVRAAGGRRDPDLAHGQPGVLPHGLGLVGFILTIGHNVGVGIFLLFLCLLGAGGIAYGVLKFLKMKKGKYFKEEKEPSKEPNEKPQQA